MNIFDKFICNIIYIIIKNIYKKKYFKYILMYIVNKNKKSQNKKQNTNKRIIKSSLLADYIKSLISPEDRGSDCLTESVAIYLVCIINKINVMFHVGISRRENFIAHAWIEVLNKKDMSYEKRFYYTLI